MVKTKNSAGKVVAFMLVLALVVSLLAFITPKQTAQVQAATLDREPGLYEAGTTNQTHTWDEVMAKLYAGKYESMAGFYFTVTAADDAWFTGDLVMGDFDTTENAALGRDVVLQEMFKKCTNLVSVDISKASFPGYVNLCSMCKNATSIKSFNFGSFKVNNLSSYMTFLEFFYGCTNLKTVSGSIDFTGLDKEVYTMGEVSAKGGRIASMFENCTSLESMDLTQLLKNTDILLGAYSLFKGCTSLKSVKVGSTLSTAIYFDNMFANCTSLKRIRLGALSAYANIALPTAPDGTHYAVTSDIATSITSITGEIANKTIELYGADNKSLAPAEETPVVPSTGVVSNTVAIVIVAVSMLALAVCVRKKKVR